MCNVGEQESLSHVFFHCPFWKTQIERFFVTHNCLSFALQMGQSLEAVWWGYCTSSMGSKKARGKMYEIMVVAMEHRSQLWDKRNNGFGGFEDFYECDICYPENTQPDVKEQNCEIESTMRPAPIRDKGLKQQVLFDLW